MEQVFIPKDSLVKVYFKNGTVIEGVVLTWNDKKGLLQSPDSQNRMIIYSPIENVMMVKLCYPEMSTEEDESEDALLQEPSQEPSQDVSQIETIEQPIAKRAFQEVSYDLGQYESDSLGYSGLPVPSKASNTTIQDRTKKIVNLRLSQASQERKKIAESMRRSIAHTSVSLDFSKQPPKVETPYYGSPNFTKRGAFLDSRKKDH